MSDQPNPVEAERLRGVVYISLGRHERLEKCERENVTLKAQLMEAILQRDNAALLLRNTINEALQKVFTKEEL